MALPIQNWDEVSSMAQEFIFQDVLSGYLAFAYWANVSSGKNPAEAKIFASGDDMYRWLVNNHIHVSFTRMKWGTIIPSLETKNGMKIPLVTLLTVGGAARKQMMEFHLHLGNIRAYAQRKTREGVKVGELHPEVAEMQLNHATKCEHIYAKIFA